MSRKEKGECAFVVRQLSISLLCGPDSQAPNVVPQVHSVTQQVEKPVHVAVPLLPKVKRRVGENAAVIGVIIQVEEPTDWCSGMYQT